MFFFSFFGFSRILCTWWGVVDAVFFVLKNKRKTAVTNTSLLIFASTSLTHNETKGKRAIHLCIFSPSTESTRNKMLLLFTEINFSLSLLTLFPIYPHAILAHFELCIFFCTIPNWSTISFFVFNSFLSAHCGSLKWSSLHFLCSFFLFLRIGVIFLSLNNSSAFYLFYNSIFIVHCSSLFSLMNSIHLW